MSENTPPIWQPQLHGAWVRARPLVEADFEPLFAAAADPLIWEQHPEPGRFRREEFTRFFRGAMEGGSALAVFDQLTGRMIGSSRFTPAADGESAEIGHTFFAREFWRRGHNRELKLLMLNHAFAYVPTVQFFVGDQNLRSQASVQRLGGVEVRRLQRPAFTGEGLRITLVFELDREDWSAHAPSLAPSFTRASLSTARLELAAVDESHAAAMHELFADPLLHVYVPEEPPTLEKMRERCGRWARGRSKDGRELWLNWVASERASGQIIAHFQAGVASDGTATLGYLVKRERQRRGYAHEGLVEVFRHLRARFAVKQVKAFADSRNVASRRLAERLGMRQVARIERADFFRGLPSDELVFAKYLE